MTIALIIVSALLIFAVMALLSQSSAAQKVEDDLAFSMEQLDREEEINNAAYEDSANVGKILKERQDSIDNLTARLAETVTNTTELEAELAKKITDLQWTVENQKATIDGWLKENREMGEANERLDVTNRELCDKVFGAHAERAKEREKVHAIVVALGAHHTFNGVEVPVSKLLGGILANVRSKQEQIKAQKEGLMEARSNAMAYRSQVEEQIAKRKKGELLIVEMKATITDLDAQLNKQVREGVEIDTFLSRIVSAGQGATTLREELRRSFPQVPARGARVVDPGPRHPRH
mgnify:CR=1 FL=1|tara:strand:- start:36105 stop:36980 length:876 start_codon:yes stop_codon:yes gene_type:complete